MSTPVISEHDVTVYCGGALAALDRLPSGSANCIVTSPPYYGLRDYGVEGQIGLEKTPPAYVEKLRAVFDEARRVLRSDGVLWLNLGDTYSTRVAARASSHQDGLNGADYAKDWKRDKAKGLTRMPTFLPEKNLMGIPWRVAFALQDDGWTLRNDIIWHKPNGMPDSAQDRLSPKHEYLFMFSKSQRYWFDLDAIKVEGSGLIAGNTPDGQARYGAHTGTSNGARRFGGNPGSTLLHAHERVNPGDVWSINTVPFPGAHYATFPPDIPRRCILSGCPSDGIVLDPFAGSGTTLMVARMLGRKSIGIELNPDSIDIIRERIGPETLNFGEVAHA